jgi:hypothetical protein
MDNQNYNQNNGQYNQYGNFPQPPIKKPLAGGCLTLGILGIVFCATVVLGLVFSIVGLSSSTNFQRSMQYNTSPGKVLSIIGLVLSVLGCSIWL